MTVAKFELVFARYRNNLQMVGNLTVTNSLQDLMAKNCTYSLRFDQSRSKVSKNVRFSSFSSVHLMPFSKCAAYSSVFKIYRFQNLPAKNVPFSCEWEAYP